MKTLITILVCSAFFISDPNSNTLSGNKQNANEIKKRCVNTVTFSNVTSSALTIIYITEISSNFSSVTVPANTTVPIYNAGPWGDDPGSWTFRILGGLDGSIACFEQNTGVTGCVTTSIDGRFYEMYYPFNGSCGTAFDFVFADYPQCN